MTQPPTENKPDFPHDDPLVVPQTERDIAQQTDKHAETTRDPLEVVLSEFSDALQRGTEPSIADYAARYPDLADQIRELFPLLQGLGQWKEDREIDCMRRNFPREICIKRLGDYQLERELGRGGMGIVFQAVHITSQRTVAIKLLPWRFAAEMTVWKGRLQHEAATIAALNHPNIVPIYSFAEDQGYSFYVMQLIDGIGLDRMIEQLQQQRKKTARRQRRVAIAQHIPFDFDSWRGFAGIGEQVAMALAYAHKHHVCHNDIKPSNLLVRTNRQVVVTDFGIGRLPEGEFSETDDHAIGTLKYMAPERLEGVSSPHSDIYSLGATLYELATQTPLFDFRKRSQWIDAIRYQKPISPRKIIPEIPEPFERIILKAIAKDPADRYRTAKSMAADLKRFSHRQEVHAANPSILQQLLKRCRSWKLPWQ